MSGERTLPIPSEHREFKIKVDGQVVERSQHLLAVCIIKSVNKIASARLIYMDGSASTGDFPLSNGNLFIPGKKIEILAGSNNNQVLLFKGIVIKQNLKIRKHTAPHLIIECRHIAVQLTVGRKNTYFSDKTDSEIISDILNKSSISCDVETTSIRHKQQVQYYASDWDFMLMRAEANGKLVYTIDDKVLIKKPEFNGTAVCTLLYGATILELDSEIDARNQYSQVKSYTWDPTQQIIHEKEAADPKVKEPGNLNSNDLANVIGIDHLHLQNSSITEDEAQAWADAMWLKSKMAKTNGRIKCEGIGNMNPGDIVTLRGLGDRYNGDVFVTGVRHDFDLAQGWKTNIQFGSTETWFGEEQRISASKVSGLLPGINGLQIGVVVSNEDPDGEHRIRVKMPLVNKDDEGTWARVASVDAGNERGFFFRPEIGDEVVMGFLNDDPRQAIVLGMLHSSAKAAPIKGSDDNHEKVYQSRSKMKFYFNDEKKIMEFITPAGNSITLSEEEKAIKITDQNGNKIEMTSSGIKIESSKAIELKACTEVKMESGTSFSAKGGTEIKIEGASGVEVSSPAVTKIKGSILNLN
jgi:Rhs element Vgr protein